MASSIKMISNQTVENPSIYVPKVAKYAIRTWFVNSRLQDGFRFKLNIWDEMVIKRIVNTFCSRDIAKYLLGDIYNFLVLVDKSIKYDVNTDVFTLTKPEKAYLGPIKMLKYLPKDLVDYINCNTICIPKIIIDNIMENLNLYKMSVWDNTEENQDTINGYIGRFIDAYYDYTLQDAIVKYSGDRSMRYITTDVITNPIYHVFYLIITMSDCIVVVTNKKGNVPDGIKIHTDLHSKSKLDEITVVTKVHELLEDIDSYFNRKVYFIRKGEVTQFEHPTPLS